MYTGILLLGFACPFLLGATSGQAAKKYQYNTCIFNGNGECP